MKRRVNQAKLQSEITSPQTGTVGMTLSCWLCGHMIRAATRWGFVTLNCTPGSTQHKMGTRTVFLTGWCWLHQPSSADWSTNMGAVSYTQHDTRHNHESFGFMFVYTHRRNIYGRCGFCVYTLGSLLWSSCTVPWFPLSNLWEETTGLTKMCK